MLPCLPTQVHCPGTRYDDFPEDGKYLEAWHAGVLAGLEILCFNTTFSSAWFLKPLWDPPRRTN
jgi:hypothetical protein